MRPERNEDLSDELAALLGPDSFLALVESFGGERIFIPSIRDAEELIAVVGPEAARALQSAYGSTRLNVPLARAVRARAYRAAGKSDREIARRLGVTVSGLERLFRRMPDRPRRPARKTDPRQLDLDLLD